MFYLNTYKFYELIKLEKKDIKEKVMLYGMIFCTNFVF